ncbi:MAG: hypothetical protein KGL39_27805 [Patescibacteria group bacterium]|nr:hypothetical protein [Patescibacteria group bacterium]
MNEIERELRAAAREADPPTRARIDAALQRMARDAEYQRLAERIAEANDRKARQRFDEIWRCSPKGIFRAQLPGLVFFLVIWLIALAAIAFNAH